MKKKSVVIFAYALALILPAVNATARILIYQLEINHYPVLTTFMTIVFICGSFVIGKSRNQSVYLLLAATIIHMLFSMWKSDSLFVTSLSLVWVLVSIVLIFLAMKSVGGKIIFGIISTLVCLACGFFMLVFFSFGQIGETSVVKIISSPNDKYQAEVIEVDQGALGGNILVEVSANSNEIKVCIFEFRKRPKTVYTGEWGEAEKLDVYWDSEGILVINGEKYTIY